MKISIVIPDTNALLEWIPLQKGHIGDTWRYIDQFPKVKEKGAYLNWWNDRWNRWNQLLQPYNRYHGFIERIIKTHDDGAKILSACEYFCNVQAGMRLAAYSKENDLSREEILLSASRTLRYLDYQALAMLERLKNLKKTIDWLGRFLPQGEPRRLYGEIYNTAKQFIGEYFGTHYDHASLLRQIDDYLKGNGNLKDYERLDSEYRGFFDTKHEIDTIRQALMDQGEALMPLLHKAVELRGEVDSGFARFVEMKDSLLIEECDLEPERIEYAPVAAWVGPTNVIVQFTTGKRASLPIKNYYRLKTFKGTSRRSCLLSPVFIMFPEVNVTIHIDEFLNEYGEPIFPEGSEKDWLIKHEKRRAYLENLRQEDLNSAQES